MEAGLFFFFSVAVCIFGIAALDYLMGKLSQTSRASCLEGWRRGRMQALDDGFGWGLSCGSGSFPRFGTSL